MTHAAPARPPIYDIIGFQGVRRIVDRFMFKVQRSEDEIFTLYFMGQDIRLIKAHQYPLLSELWGGPKRYRGRDLAIVHRMIGRNPDTGQRFNVRERDYEIVSDDILAATLEEHPPRFVIVDTEKLLVATTPVICNLGKYAGTDQENAEAARRLDIKMGLGPV